ncbi:MAG TPA: methyltransferase domain-containing protein [Gaiellales bacterium]|nr:methyltransferase domain-containing protein [Gaiellales bacterium]
MTERRIDPLAEAFSGAADRYQRGRPNYRPEPIDWAWETLGLAGDATVVDLAAGTGKLAVQLAGRAGRLIAVEPLEGMRAVLAVQVPEAEVVDGTAEHMPLPDGRVDAVFVGEAFHWFDGDRALPEIHRVLCPRGGLVLVWNSGDWLDEAWSDEVFARIDREPKPDVRPENRPWTGLWRRFFEQTPLFDPLEMRSFPHVVHTDIAGFVLMVSTWSFVAALPEHARELLAADLTQIMERAGVDRVELKLRTDVHLTRAR